MIYFIYDIVTTLALPIAIVWLAIFPSYRQLLARFAPLIPSTSERPLWIQACSVGEVIIAMPIINEFKKRHPHISVVLTTSTIRGYELASSRSNNNCHLTWFPVDQRWVVRRFVRSLNPIALVLIETEIWPNVLREAEKNNIPVVLMSGRLSDKHFRRYNRYHTIVREFFSKISMAGMQNDQYAARISTLGADLANVHVTGNTKFDAVQTSIDPVRRTRIKEENGFKPGHRVLVFGSTTPGDEKLAAQCWTILQDEFPDLRLIIAPLHLKRLKEVVAPFNEGILRRTQVKRGLVCGAERVFILDTIGELAHFYSIATIAVIGGSFFSGIEGHNPLESAGLGVATVFGPYMGNFMDPTRILIENNGALQVPTAGDLLPSLRRLLTDSDARTDIARNGRIAVIDNRGAIQMNLDLLDKFL